MNQEISVELHFFMISVLWGGVILLAYDCLRIIRRLIKHGIFFVAAEDLIFWVAASVFIFSMIYNQNNGIIRGFSVMGMSAGMLLYHFLLKDSVVNIIVIGIRILLSPLAAAYKAVKRGFKFVFSKVKNVFKFLTKQLKKLLKSVKMRMDKRRQAIAAKYQKRQEKRAALRKNVKKKPSGKKKGDNQSPVLKPEPVPKFSRVSPEELRQKREAAYPGKLNPKDTSVKQ